MTRSWRTVFVGAGAALFLAACADTVPPADVVPASGHLNAYFVLENLDIQGPTTYYLTPADDGQPHVILWCDSDDEWDQILEVGGKDVTALKHDRLVEDLSGHNGWPIHLVVRPKSGAIRALDCFPTPKATTSKLAHPKGVEPLTF